MLQKWMRTVFMFLNLSLLYTYFKLAEIHSLHDISIYFSVFVMLYEVKHILKGTKGLF